MRKSHMRENRRICSALLHAQSCMQSHNITLNQHDYLFKQLLVTGGVFFYGVLSKQGRRRRALGVECTKVLVPVLSVDSIVATYCCNVHNRP